MGSINGKNGQLVRRLKIGEKVSPASVVDLQERICAAPFRTVLQVLVGTEQMSPCPFCGQETLKALDHAGVCYGCGKVTFERLCSTLFQRQKAVEV